MRVKNRRHTAASQGVTKEIIVASTAPFNGGVWTGLDVTLEVLLSHHPLGHSTVIASRYSSSVVPTLGGYAVTVPPISHSQPALACRCG
jgi:hypothetical protein